MAGGPNDVDPPSPGNPRRDWVVTALLLLLVLSTFACPRPPAPATVASPCPDAPHGRVEGRGICVDCRGVIVDADGGGVPPGEPCKARRLTPGVDSGRSP